MNPNQPRRWEVWLANVKFEDSNLIKTRPVIVAEDKTVYFLCYKITGQPPRTNIQGEYEIIEWQSAGLDTISTVRLSQPIKLLPDKFIRKLGSLKTKDIMRIKLLLMNMTI